MSGKPVIPRARATQDIDDAVAYYLAKASESVAMGFLSELEQAFSHLSCFAETGSNRYAYELNVPGLRAWPLGSYPYVIFYMPMQDHIDVPSVIYVDGCPRRMTDVDKPFGHKKLEPPKC